MNKKSIENAAEFRKPFVQLQKGVVALQKIGKQAWSKVKRTCEEDSKSQTERLKEVQTEKNKLKMKKAFEIEAFGVQQAGETNFVAGLTANCRKKAIVYARQSLARKSQLVALNHVLDLTNNIKILNYNRKLLCEV